MKTNTSQQNGTDKLSVKKIKEKELIRDGKYRFEYSEINKTMNKVVNLRIL